MATGCSANEREFQPTSERRDDEERSAASGMAAEDLSRKVLSWPTTSTWLSRPGPRRRCDPPGSKGVDAIDRKRRALLESEGVTPIEAGPGTPFDPREHDAIANVPGLGTTRGRDRRENPARLNLRDRLLRPAVAVAAGEAGRPPPESLQN